MYMNMTTHKSEDYKLSAVQYYLVEDVSHKKLLCKNQKI